MAEYGGSAALLAGSGSRSMVVKSVPLLLVGFCELDLHSVDAVYAVNEEN